VAVPSPSELPPLLCAITSCFKSQPMNFMCTQCVGVYLVG
jgi:hypothetical protein